ncbi:MAG: dipeptide epimerase [Pseudorhodoplanes sp.]|nr:dipeptide epimerase [Pseudorhodoplanes sp.]
MVKRPPSALTTRIERFPIRGSFAISRGAKTEAVVVVAELADGGCRGRGECVPYARYGETPDEVAATIERLRAALADGLDREGLQSALPPGAARNALDCAFWDLEAKRSGQPVHVLAGLPAPRPVVTAYTISLAEPEAMAQAARAAAHRPLLKIKLGGQGEHGDAERLAAIRAAVPGVELIVDANEGWSRDNIERNLAACARAGVTLVEQPLPAGDDEFLRRIARPIPVCADESVHDRASLAALAGKYDAINVKLDKTGGLTEALLLVREAERLGLVVMVGCMVATSLSMAPALLIAQTARVADLDGPLLLATDRENGLVYEGSLVHPPERVLWG